MKKTNVAGRAVSGLGQAEHPQRGDFEIQAGQVWVCCPGCGTSSALKLGEPHPDKRPAEWKLTGTPDKPTLKPSINHVGCWHGWLTDGQFTSCA